MKRQLSKVRTQMDIFWRQRGKQHWMRDGDRNTKNFHRVASMRRRYSAIDKIVVEGECYGDVSSAKDDCAFLQEAISVLKVSPIIPLVRRMPRSWLKSFRRRKSGRRSMI